MFLLPRELRDQVYRALFIAGHKRLRLVNPVESARIRTAALEGRECKAWPTRCRSGAVVTTMLDGSDLLAVNRQIRDEFMEVLLEENEILLAIPKASFKVLRFGPDVPSFFKITATERMVLEMTRVLEVSPFFWEQLDVFVPFLRRRKTTPFKSLTINFCRLLNEFCYDARPSSHEANARLAHLATVGKVAENARIVWTGSGEPEFILKRVEDRMMGKVDLDTE
jgi:hypothetical protein